MASRRAAARAAAVAEKEPEKKEEKKSLDDNAEYKEESFTAGYRKSTRFEKLKKEEEEEEEKRVSMANERVTEKITERIIICPPGQNQCIPPPCRPCPPQGYCNCPTGIEGEERRRKRKGKKSRRKGELGGEGICQHPYCIVQRAKIRSLGLPHPPPPTHPYPPPPQPSQPPVVICQKPVLCCCSKCNESDSSDSEGDDPRRDEVANHMKFINLVMATANAIKDMPKCDQLFL